MNKPVTAEELVKWTKKNARHLIRHVESLPVGEERQKALHRWVAATDKWLTALNDRNQSNRP